MSLVGVINPPAQQSETIWAEIDFAKHLRDGEVIMTAVVTAKEKLTEIDRTTELIVPADVEILGSVVKQNQITCANAVNKMRYVLEFTVTTDAPHTYQDELELPIRNV